MMKVTSPPPPPPLPDQVIEVSGKYLVSQFLPSMDGYLVAQKCEQVAKGVVIIMCVIHVLHCIFSPQRYSNASSSMGMT